MQVLKSFVGVLGSLLILNSIGWALAFLYLATYNLGLEPSMYSTVVFVRFVGFVPYETALLWAGAGAVITGVTGLLLHRLTRD